MSTEVATLNRKPGRSSVADLPVASADLAANVGVIALRIGHRELCDVVEVYDRVHPHVRAEDLLVATSDGMLLVFGSAFVIDDAVRVADRMRQLIGTDPTAPCIVSAGAAVVMPGEAVLDAMQRAQRALWQAHSAGGSCTVARSLSGRRKRTRE